MLLLLYEIEGMFRWSDAPYSWHLVPEELRGEPPEPLEREERSVLTCILVNSRTGLIEGLRAVTLSASVSAALHRAIRAQADAPFDRATFDAQLQALYRHFPDSRSLLRVAVR